MAERRWWSRIDETLRCRDSLRPEVMNDIKNFDKSFHGRTSFHRDFSLSKKEAPLWGISILKANTDYFARFEMNARATEFKVQQSKSELRLAC